MRIPSALALGGVLLLSSCDPFGTDAELGICDSLHGVLGSQTVTAVTSGDEDVVTGGTDELIAVNLVPVTGGNGGKVLLAASMGEHYFFMSDVPLTITDDQGNALPVSDCPLATVRCGSGTRYQACRKVGLPEGAPYHLELGPTAETIAFFATRGL
jgi:hypothetical protein